MTQNMGVADRAIRTALAVVAAGLYITGRIGGTIGLVLLVLAVVFLLTSLFGRCPLYLPFGLSTRARSGSGTGSS